MMMSENRTSDNIVPDAIEKSEPGDAIGVRSSWGAIVVGVIGQINDKPSPSFRDGDWIAIIDDPVMWDVSDGGGRRITVDKGEPVSRRTPDWDGPGVSVAVGTNRHSFDLSGDVILRQPKPVYESGSVSHYIPLPAGRVEEIATGGIVDPKEMLEEYERPPAGVRE